MPKSKNSIPNVDQLIAKANPTLDRLGEKLFPEMAPGAERTFKAKSQLTGWQDDLLNVGTSLLLGFAIGDITGVDDDSIGDVQGTFDQIQASIDGLSSQLDSITAILQSLPNIIVGIIDNAFAANALSDAKTRMGQIQDKTRDTATYMANRDDVSALIDDLETSINAVWTFTGNGMMGATLTCGITGVWAQTKSLLLLDPVTNPSKYTIHDMNFYQTTKQTYQTIISAMTQQNASASTAYQNIPNTAIPNGLWEWLDQLSGFALDKLPVLRSKSMEFTLEPNVSSTELYCYADRKKGSILKGTVPWPISMPLPDNLGWGNNGFIVRAGNAWPGLLAVRSQYESLFSYVTNSAQAYSMIKQALP